MQNQALTGMGLSVVSRFFRALLDRQPFFSFSSGFEAAARRIKKQTLHGVQGQIDQFHAQLKHRYFTPLIQAVTRDVIDKIQERFSMYESLDTTVAASGAGAETEKKNQQEKINGILTQLKQIRGNILQLKEADVHQHSI